MADPITECPACLSQDIFPYRQTKDYRVTQESFELVRCPQCGLVITQPQPPESAINRYYETDDYISHAAEVRSMMDRLYYGVRRWMVERKKALIERHSIGKDLVDIGTGTGFFALHMRNAGWQVNAFEPSADARRVAKDKHHLEVQEIGKLFDLPGDSADVVTMWHVLEHVHDPNAYIQLIHRVLRDEGMLLIAVPNYQSYDARAYGEYWGAWDVPRHLWHFNPESVFRLLDRHGFKVQKKYVMRFDAFYVALISEKYRRTGFFGYIRAIVIGCLSNILSLFYRSRGSSIIYVAEKRKH
jgi:2-polyprenyl-3-methyl-5-hydroxy-6-metoxy-1,4-benzoquinol methylase